MQRTGKQDEYESPKSSLRGWVCRGNQGVYRKRQRGRDRKRQRGREKTLFLWKWFHAHEQNAKRDLPTDRQSQSSPESPQIVIFSYPFSTFVQRNKTIMIRLRFGLETVWDWIKKSKKRKKMSMESEWMREKNVTRRWKNSLDSFFLKGYTFDLWAFEDACTSVAALLFTSSSINVDKWDRTRSNSWERFSREFAGGFSQVRAL